MSDFRLLHFEIPEYLEALVGRVVDTFNESGIKADVMLQYMLDNDINGWIHYYAYVFIIPSAQGQKIDVVRDLNELYAFVLTGYILDSFRENRLDIKLISKG